jgi:GNAT superfamily N-acetyltransferase
VGFAAFGPPDDDPSVPVGSRPPAGAGEVYAIYLDERVAGRGVGRALFDRAVGGLRAGGFGRAFLWVLEANERARRFYENAGWAWDGAAGTHRFDCANLPVVRYAGDLAPAERS